MTLAAPKYGAIAAKTWPIVLANTAGPILGFVDTAVIGHTGQATDLGAIALGSLIFNFIYWGFGFLRMGTSGFTAQAMGAGNESEIRNTLGRALLQATALSIPLVALQRPIADLALALFQGSHEVETVARSYFEIRIWGAPASLCIYCLLGTLIGLGKSRLLLVSQFFLNGINACLDVYLAKHLNLGVRGIAAGTAISEWMTLLLLFYLVIRMLRQRQQPEGSFWQWSAIKDTRNLVHTLRANTDILIRTAFLILGFAWFTNQSAKLGDVALASNHVLLQFLTFSAFFLDSYAYVAEALVGNAIGAKRPEILRIAILRTTVLAAWTAALLAALFLFEGARFVRWLTEHESIVASATDSLPYAATYIFVSFAAFQLDGIFIGATRTQEMRNASILSVATFIACASWLVPRQGNDGLWLSFIIYVAARAVSLLARFRSITRSAT